MRDELSNNLRIMIVRRENGGVGQGYSFAIACKVSVATGCLQTGMIEPQRRTP